MKTLQYVFPPQQMTLQIYRTIETEKEGESSSDDVWVYRDLISPNHRHAIRGGVKSVGVLSLTNHQL